MRWNASMKRHSLSQRPRRRCSHEGEPFRDTIKPASIWDHHGRYHCETNTSASDSLLRLIDSAFYFVSARTYHLPLLADTSGRWRYGGNARRRQSLTSSISKAAPYSISCFFDCRKSVLPALIYREGEGRQEPSLLKTEEDLIQQRRGR